MESLAWVKTVGKLSIYIILFDIKGCLFYYNDLFIKDNLYLFSFSSSSSNVIAVTCRSEWDRMSQKIAEDYRNKKLQAIIVVDDNIGCDDDKFKNCFRPSFPYPKV